MADPETANAANAVRSYVACNKADQLFLAPPLEPQYQGSLDSLYAGDNILRKGATVSPQDNGRNPVEERARLSSRTLTPSSNDKARGTKAAIEGIGRA